ncbi:hypothetical protein CALCODRAFT_415849, partial [Calocera cornea HHB12733]
VFDLFGVEFALSQFQVEVVFSKDLKHLLHSLVMGFHIVGEYQDIFTKDIIHHGLEGAGAVDQAEKHHERFEQAAICSECCLPLISLFDPDIVVTPLNI